MAGDVGKSSDVQLPAAAGAKQPGDDPSELHPEIKRLQEHHELNRALLGGTRAMRAAGQKYLPRMMQEGDKTYNERLKLTVLRNFYRQAIAALSGKLMAKGLQLDLTNSKGLTAGAADWLKDLDACGTAGDVLFKRSFTWAIRDAKTWLLADTAPTIDPDSGRKLTLAEEREFGVRPWLIPLSIYDVIGWQTQKVRGRDEITQFRYYMAVEEPLGPFGMRTVQVIRVVEPTVIYDMRKNDRGGWEKVPGREWQNTLGRVPVTAFASDADEDYHPRGGMNDLAELNMEHWQIRSDQRLTLRLNSFPILFGKGMKALPPIGPEMGVTVESSDAGTDLKYVEAAGSSIVNGRQELIDLEDAMRGQSAMYQARQAQPQTATGAAIDAKDANSPAQGWAINAKRGFEQAMNDMCALAGNEGAQCVLNVDTDALVASFDAAKLAELRAARASREISREVYLAQLVRWEVLPDDYDAEADKELLDAEPPEDVGGLNTPPKKGA